MYMNEGSCIDIDIDISIIYIYRSYMDLYGSVARLYIKRTVH